MVTLKVMVAVAPLDIESKCHEMLLPHVVTEDGVAPVTFHESGT